MEKIRIGIICPSEIAFRRFMPALMKSDDFIFNGIAVANKEEWAGSVKDEVIENEVKKAQSFIKQYGGKIYHSYHDLLASDEIDAVYLPLPPALHYKWAKKALMNGKHVFIEKPSTTSLQDTNELIEIAKQKNLAIHENYMFIYHNQIRTIKTLLEEKKIGDIRSIRAAFGFPKRPLHDFRYNKSLGGGALLDCGGYPIRLMQLLLGNDIDVDAARLYHSEMDVDMYGSVQLSNKKGVAQISFGMDNGYRCDLEIWGSKGILYTNRIFSAPDTLTCSIHIEINHEIETIELLPDDTFKKSIDCFKDCVKNETIRTEEFLQMERQISLVQKVFEVSGAKCL